MNRGGELCFQNCPVQQGMALLVLHISSRVGVAPIFVTAVDGGRRSRIAQKAENDAVTDRPRRR